MHYWQEVDRLHDSSYFKAVDSRGVSSELARLCASIHLTPIATIVTDNRLADNPIIEVNDAFLSLTGYSRTEVLGRNCRFLAGPATEPEAQLALRTSIKQGKPVIIEITNYKKNGTSFRNAVMLAPVHAGDGSIAMFIGSQMRIAEGVPKSGLRYARARDLMGQLSPRLRQTVELMAMGYRNKEIATLLEISEKTVKMHRALLIKALGVRTTADAIRIAVEAGIFYSAIE